MYLAKRRFAAKTPALAKAISLLLLAGTGGCAGTPSEETSIDGDDDDGDDDDDDQASESDSIEGEDGTEDTGMSGGSPSSGEVSSSTTSSPPATSNTTDTTDDSFEVQLSLSSTIATVGIVEWSLDAEIESAHIDFGRDPSVFEFRAPVDLSAPGYRTLLLGMKPDTTYAVQVVAMGGGQTFASEIYMLETGFLPNGLPVLDVQDQRPESLYGGFTTLCTGVSSGGFGGGGGGSAWVFTFDRDGDYVWAYDVSDTAASGCSRARMSFDGQSMWAGNFSNVTPDGALVRVNMDGEGEPEDFSLPGRHHDFAVLPNNHILFFEQANGGTGIGSSEGPDIIKELDPETGTVTELYHQDQDFAAQIAESGAHTNQINYVPHMEAISFSMRHTSTIGLISYPAADLLAVFGGPTSEFSEMDWQIQHGHEVLENSLLVFNNEGSNGGSSILEYQFDLQTSTSSLIFDYSSGNTSLAFGDVKRLPNGNTLITYSSTGVLHEVDPSGELLREIQMDPVGYAEHRKTLYGPPPPFSE